MNILYIHQYFKTPQEPGGTRSYWIAQELIKNGHAVTMITADPKVKWPKNTGQSKININLLSHERNTKEIQFSL